MFKSQNSRIRTFGLLVLCTALTASAQQHFGADTFSYTEAEPLIIPSSNWDYGFRLSGSNGNGLLSVDVTNGRLEFTKGAGTGSYFIGWNNDSNTSTTSTPVSASFTNSWVMNMTVTNSLGLTGGNFATIGFEVTDSSGNYYAQMLSSTNGGYYFRTEWNGGASSVNPIADDNTDVYLRIGWDANSQTLSSYYSTTGSSYTLANTFNPVGTWNANLSNGFYFEVFGRSNFADAINAGSIYADNFSVSAVPEPSTYAAIAGLGALGLAFWRKRRARTV